MARLLLISNSTNHGERYLAHCEDAVRSHLDGVDTLVFVPYALFDREAYTANARKRFAEMGIAVESPHESEDPVATIESAQAVFIGGGNTFRLLSTLQGERLLEPLRKRVRQGMPYMGASAGTNVACPTVRTTNDMPIVEPSSLTALGLVPFQINAHYLDPDLNSVHMGETRETRITEYLEENPGPVLGLREGSALAVNGEERRLLGPRPARLFERGREPRELEPGSEVSFLWG